MNSSSSSPSSVAVIGGGVSGMAAAHRLVELKPDVKLRVYEASSKLGGVLETESSDGFQVELGSDSFLSNQPGAVDLCRRLGMEDELLQTNDAFRKTLIVHRGKLQEVPVGFMLMAPARIWPILTTPILSWRAKLRLAWEYFVPVKQDDEDESIAHFVRRRLGREAYDHLVQPLVGGIYTGDADQLSLAALQPRFAEMERVHGGLIRASRKSKSSATENSGARYSLFVTPRDGLSSIINRIAERLPEDSVALNARVERVEQLNSGGWKIHCDGDSAEPSREFDAVVMAAPAPIASGLTREIDASLADLLDGIPYAGAAVVSVGYNRSQIQHPLDAFGFVVPEVENRRILACSFSSVKFTGRAPEGKVLLRTFLGGVKQSDLVELSDDELRATVAEELADLLGVEGEPEFCRVGRYRNKMPQYLIGHLQRVAEIDARTAKLSGLELTGNAYRGVGIPDCIVAAEQTAERVLSGESC
ncbi:MAG: protoporphyrinogen oxidase [Planctomycetales bacterium]